jgi:hypothetical protein
MTPRSAAIALAGVAVVVSACTAPGEASREPAGTSVESSPSPSSPPPSEAAPSPDAVLPSAALACADYIDTSPPPGDFEIVAGVVALPTSPGHVALQASDGGSGSAERLFAKTGLLVRAGATFELVVPSTVADRMAVVWGSPGTPTRRLTVNACRPRDGSAAGWLAYPGGYLVDEEMCAPLDVVAQSTPHRVLLGIGHGCPGQAAPPR